MNSVKLQDTKLIYRNLLHFYILTTNYEIIPFTITSKINLTKKVKDLYLEKCKILMKEIKDDTTEGKINHVHGFEELILLE